MLKKYEVDAIEDAMDRLRGRDVTFDFRPDGSVWALYAGADGTRSAEPIVGVAVVAIVGHPPSRRSVHPTAEPAPAAPEPRSARL